MPAVLSDKGLELLENLPPFLRDDPVVQGAEDSAALELERIQEAIDLLVSNFFASTADDFLKFWEERLGLSIEPEGLSVSTRRNRVLAFLRRIKRAQSGLTWQERLTELIGSDWTHVEDDPNGLRGIWYDTFSSGLDGWTFDIGSAGDFTQSGEELVPTGAGEYQAYVDGDLEDQYVDLGFRRGTADTTVVGVVLKRIDDENLLTCEYTGGDIRIRKKEGGSWSTLSSTAFATSADTDYWLRGTIVDDDVQVDIWTRDPIQQIAATETDTHTLAGGDETTFGATVEGDTGFYLDDAQIGWKLLNARGGEAGYALDDYTLRIVLPFGGSSEAGIVETLAREITPANLELEVVYDSDFVLGYGELGTDIF